VPPRRAAYAACTGPFTTSTLSDGSHTFEVRAIDGAGNVDPTPAGRTFTVDTVPPDKPPSPANPGSSTNDNAPTFTFTASEAGSAFQCRIDVEGVRRLHDAVHERSSGRRHAHLRGPRDDTGRQHRCDASVLGLHGRHRRARHQHHGRAAAGSTTNDNAPTFTFTSTEANSTFQCRLDAAAYGDCTTPFTSATLADGNPHLRGAGDDALGNADPTRQRRRSR
jgi:hypothetical protein